MLLDVNLSGDVLILVIKVLCWIIGTMITLFSVIIGVMHKGMTKRLDNIDFDIKPIVTQVAIHTEQIMEIKKDQAESIKWLNNHDSRIQGLERVTSKHN